MRRYVCRCWLCCRFLLSDTLFLGRAVCADGRARSRWAADANVIYVRMCVYVCGHIHIVILERMYVCVRYPFYASLHWNFFFAFFSNSSKLQHLRSFSLSLSFSLYLCYSLKKCSLYVKISLHLSLPLTRSFFPTVCARGILAATHWSRSNVAATPSFCMCVFVCVFKYMGQLEVLGENW